MAKAAQKVAEGAARYVTAETQGAERLLQNLDIWTAATRTKSTSGRGSGRKVELAGIKKLRELILELAVRGKLVPQDPCEEPASVLLERIQEEKAQLIAEGKVKKQKALPPSGDDQKELSLPDGWILSRLDDLSEINGGYAFKSTNYSITGHRVVRISDFDEEGFKNESVVRHEYTRELESFTLQSRTILMAMTGGTVGKTLLVRRTGEPMLVNQRVASIALSEFVSEGYVDISLRTRVVKAVIAEAKNSTNDNISMGDIRSFVVHLPPLEEQHRIVAKVGELMALCDQLEQQAEQQLDAHQQLVETLLGTLTQSQNADELAANWQRLAEHFDLLFSGPMGEWAVDRLKDTILQLAVMGKLVPQDPNDEPASALLERIQQEKARLIAEGKIKKQKSLPPISEEEKPFELPEGWAFGRVGELVSKLGSGSTPRGGKSAYVSEGIPFLRSQNVWNDGLVLDDIAYISSDTHTRMGNTVVYPGDLLLNITGASLGRSIIFPDDYPEANVSQHVTIIRFLEPQMTPFMWLCVRSPLVQSLVWGRQVGMAIEGLSKKVLERFEMPVPPLAEQRRIVDKVGSLFDLCDSLKLKIRAVGETELSLCDVLVEKALTH